MNTNEVRTSCCGALWKKTGNEIYRCAKCGNDVTLELVIIDEEYPARQGRKRSKHRKGPRKMKNRDW